MLGLLQQQLLYSSITTTGIELSIINNRTIYYKYAGAFNRKGIHTFLAVVLHILLYTLRSAFAAVVYFFSSFFFFFFSSYHPACGHKGSSHLSPVHASQLFIAMQVQHSYNSSTNG